MVEMDSEKEQIIENAVKEILTAIGEDPERTGLLETPKRVAKMYQEIFSGLMTPAFDDYKLFDSKNEDDMVLVKNIQFYSMCEHHLLPFYGKVHLAYVPAGGKVIGLSKIPRLVDYCSKRPSVQEDLTVMIAEKLAANIPNQGIAIAIEAEHMCMTIRGAKTPHSLTKTYHYTGIFKEDRDWKQDFLQALK
ncbi:GTP cyclohydrolase I FolE [Enterococcus alishanensis]